MSELSNSTIQSEGVTDPCGSSCLFESLMKVEYPDGLTQFEVVEAYLRATFVAAEVPFDMAFLQEMLVRLAERSSSTSTGFETTEGVIGISEGEPVRGIPLHEALEVGEGDVRAEAFRMICELPTIVNSEVEDAATTAFEEMLTWCSHDDLPTLLFPIFRICDNGTRNIILSILGISDSDESEIEGLGERLREFRQKLETNDAANEPDMSETQDLHSIA